jgi:head-tail adaptor
MTEPTKPDDRELEEYLKGGSTLSRRYREASGETAPAELDELILAQARAEARRKPVINRYLAPVAVAASLVLAVNLAWNLHVAEPLSPEEIIPIVPPQNRKVTPAAPRVETDASAKAAPAPAPAPELDAIEVTGSRISEQEAAAVAEELAEDGKRAKGEDRAAFKQQAEAQRQALKEDDVGIAAPVVESADLAAAATAPAAAPPLSESQKVDRLVAHVAGLEGAVFIRNGKEYGPAEAAKHLRYKREQAGSRVKTADDFIRLCASHSTLSGDAYLIRFADGRTRTAEDVLREELVRIDGR